MTGTITSGVLWSVVFAHWGRQQQQQNVSQQQFLVCSWVFLAILFWRVKKWFFFLALVQILGNNEIENACYVVYCVKAGQFFVDVLWTSALKGFYCDVVSHQKFLLRSRYFIPANSHACGLKISISRRLTFAGQFLTPDWKMWVVALLLDTISKNMLTQTHVRNENHV